MITYPLLAVTSFLLGTMRSGGTVKLGLVTSLAALAVNCGLNYLLIGGNLGAPELGVRGAAIGTLTAQALQLVLVAAYLLWKDKKIGVRPWDFFHVDRLLLTDYVQVAWPVFLTGLIWGVSNAIQTSILGHLATDAMTAYSISSTAYKLLKVAAVGASSAAAILCGQQISGGDPKQLKPCVLPCSCCLWAWGWFWAS